MPLLWTQKQDVGPTGRIFPAMTFDGSRERVLLFGGQLEVTAECDGHTVLLFGGGIVTSSLVPFGAAGAPPNYRAGGPPKPISFLSSSR